MSDKLLCDPDAIIGCQFDGKGGMILSEKGIPLQEGPPYWLHINYANSKSKQWLTQTKLVPDSVRDVLKGGSLRPRLSRLNDGALIVLRCINGNVNARADQLITLRILINDRLIISTRHRHVSAVNAILMTLKKGNGPTTSGDWLISLCDELTGQASEFIEQLHDKIINLEDALLDRQSRIPPRGELALIRKQLIILRRYMVPQRDVYARLASEHFLWMNDNERRLMQEIADRLGRALDDIDASIARTSVLADEITAVIAEAMNRRTYTMSLLAMVFLPLTFLTGLFGVNLGGIPGGQWRYGFSTFCLLLILLVFGVTVWLKIRKWL